MKKFDNLNSSSNVETDRSYPIEVGEVIHGGLRLYENDAMIKHRIIHLGLGKRIIIVGVIGAFTPVCWNEHLFMVLSNIDYYVEMGVSLICVIASNDGYTMAAWRDFIGWCPETVKMWGDVSTRFIRHLGMGLRYRMFPAGIRCRRFIIVADNLHVKQVMVAPDSGNEIISCSHLVPRTFPQKTYRKLYEKKNSSMETVNSETIKEESMDDSTTLSHNDVD